MPYAAEDPTAIKASLATLTFLRETMVRVGEAHHRRSHALDFEKENRALMHRAGASAASSSNMPLNPAEVMPEVAKRGSSSPRPITEHDRGETLRRRYVEEFKMETAAREERKARMRDLAVRLEPEARCLFATNIVGIFIWDISGAIIEANEAFLGITGHDRDDLVSGRLDWRALTPPEWREADDRRLEAIKSLEIVEPSVKEFFRKDLGRVPVLFEASIFDRSRDRLVGFVVDLTDFKRMEDAARESERRRQEAQSELVRANRLTTMGQLSTSIAHEVNQSIAAAVTDAQTALRWLGNQPPNLAKAREALGRVLDNGNRGSEIIAGIRALIKKEAPRMDRLDINNTIREVIEITHGECVERGVLIGKQFADGLTPVAGDRVQLQQVMLNLIINALEAMDARGEGPRELRVATNKLDSGGVIVAVQDSGPGVSASDLERIFEAFHSTKPDGLGMGLSVCRAIVEAHGGKLWASEGEAQGAIFQFTLPTGMEKAYATSKEKR